jgi:hypothetical protein
MNTVRTTTHPELAIAGAVTRVVQLVRAALAAIDRAAAAQVDASPPVIFGRWSW